MSHKYVSSPKVVFPSCRHRPNTLSRLITSEHLSSPSPRSRRSLLFTTTLLVPATLSIHPAHASSTLRNRIYIPAGPEIPAPVQQFFINAVQSIASQLQAPDFTARLAIYGVTPVLPSGVPGDPSIDYPSKKQGKSGRCGQFQPSNTQQPYAICSLPNHPPTSQISRECCRHLAYAVPYTPSFAFAVEDRISTVVISARLLLYDEKTWHAVLAHELGHVIDFYLWGGKRYRLKNNYIDKVLLRIQGNNDGDVLKNALENINKEDDAEYRADLLGEYFVLRPFRQRLCYDPMFLLQTVVDDPQAVCHDEGDGRSGGDELIKYVRHYAHEPLQG